MTPHYLVLLLKWIIVKKAKITPQKKAQDVLEWIIKYYTNEGDTILDPTMGSGSTGVACKTLNRNFIGIELDNEYFDVADKRINNLTINK
jgi:DNA modification methylase